MSEPTSQLERQLRRHDEELTILERIAAQINSTLDLDRIFTLALETLDDVLGFKHSMILVPEADGGLLRVVASRGYPESGAGARVELGQGVIGVVAKKRRMMRLVGLGMQRRYVAVSGTQPNHQPVGLPGLADVRSQIAIPLVAKEHLLGVYAVESPEHDAFDAVDERLLSIVGHHIAIAIDNATAYRTLERTATELRHQVAARSRELGEALARLGKLGPVELDRTIDGRYRVKRRIGVGGMGAVYEVELISGGERFALKTLRGRADIQLMARFAREAQIAAELRHPNLVPVLDVGIADGTLFLVMPLMTGGSLENQRGRFGDIAWSRPLLAQIAAGLEALHVRGVVHRDLKPANILVADGSARIADFGLAHLRDDDRHTAASVEALDETALKDITRDGDLLGTPNYMAPELAAGTTEAGLPTDIFSFGVVAYELMSGRRPFDEPPIRARLQGRVVPPPPPLGHAELAELIARCVDLEPANRPTASELVGQLADAGPSRSQR